MYNWADMILSEYRLVGQDAAEFDFRDFRGAKLERLRRGAKLTTSGSRDEALLEYTVGGDAAEPSIPSSPRLDAIDINNTSLWPSNAPSLHTMPSHTLNMVAEQEMDRNEDPAEKYWEIHQGREVNQGFPLGWPWPSLFEESGTSVYQTGDPATFWSQLQWV